MSLAIKFTPEAEDTYNSLVSQLRQRWGEQFVTKFERKISKALDTIISSPYIYPLAYENTEIRKCLIHKNCSMFYKIYDSTILIVWFWDNRQEPLFT